MHVLDLLVDESREIFVLHLGSGSRESTAAEGIGVFWRIYEQRIRSDEGAESSNSCEN